MASKQELLQWMDKTITQLEDNINNDNKAPKREDSKSYIGVEYDAKSNKYHTKYTDDRGNEHIFKSFVTAHGAAICFDALSLLVGTYANIPFPKLNFPPQGYKHNVSTKGANTKPLNTSVNSGLTRVESVRLMRQKTAEKFKLLKSLVSSAKRNLHDKAFDKLKQDLNNISTLIIDNNWRDNKFKMPKFYVKHMGDIHFKIVSMQESDTQQQLLNIFDDKLNFHQIKIFTRTKSFWDGEYSDLENNETKKEENSKINDNEMAHDTGKCDCGGFLLETKGKICSFCGDDITRLRIVLFGCTRCGFDEENALCLSCQTARNLEQVDDGDISEDDDFNSAANTNTNTNTNTKGMGPGGLDDDMSILERLERLDQIKQSKQQMSHMMGIKRLKSFEYVFPDRQNTVDMPEYQQAMQLLINPLLGSGQQEIETKKEQTESKGKDEMDLDTLSHGFGVGEFGFGARQTVSLAMKIGRKLEALKQGIEEYKEEKFADNEIFEVKGYMDWKEKNKTEQLEMVTMVEMLKEMKQLSETFFKDYVFQNEWAHHLLDVFSKVEFGDEQWDAFGLYRQKSEQLITSTDGNTITTRNILGAFDEQQMMATSPIIKNTATVDDDDDQ